MKLQKAFVLFLILITGYSYSQNHNLIDDLRKQSVNANEKNKAEFFNKIGWEYRLTHPDSTIYYCKQAFNIAQSIEEHSTTSTALNFIGLAHGYIGEYSEALKNFTIVIDRSIALEDSVNLGHGYNNIGRLLFSQGNMIKSYEYFFSALNIFESIEDRAGMGYCYKSLSELYHAQKNYDKALSMSLKALKIRQALDNSRGQLSTYHDIANIYLDKKQYKKALEYLDIAENIAKESNDKISLMETYLGISNIKQSQGDYLKALEYAQKSLDSYINIANPALLNEINLQLGEVYFVLNELPKAENLFMKIINTKTETNTLQVNRQANFYLFKIYESRNNSDQALNYLKTYIILNDSLNNNEIARTLEKMENSLSLQKFEEENKVLKVQSASALVEIERQGNRNIALLATIILIAVIVVFVYRYAQQKTKHSQKLTIINEEIEKKNSKINDQNISLEKHNIVLADINREKDNLMNIVAHDLRAPFNNIKGIAHLISLSGTLNDEQKEYIELLKNVSNKGSSLTRDILDVNAFEINEESYTISKVEVYDFVLEKHNEFLESANQKEITLTVDAIDPKLALLSEKSHLSRIMDNLISNAIKYSKNNTEVTIKAKKVRELVQFNIQDHGPGFTLEDKEQMYKKFTKLSARPTGGESSNGLGLAIVKTLTDRLKGEISLETSESGSSFTVSFPDLG